MAKLAKNDEAIRNKGKNSILYLPLIGTEFPLRLSMVGKTY